MKVMVAIARSADARMAHVLNTIGMANGFARLGHEVSFVCRQPAAGAVAPSRLRQDFGIAESVNVVQMRGTVFGRTTNAYLHFGLQAAAYARSLKPDVSYCRDYIAPVVLSAIGIPVVADSNTNQIVPSRGLRVMLYGLRNLRKFRALATNGPVLRDNFIRLGAPAHKVHVLLLGVDLGLFCRPEGYQRAKDSLRPKIVYAGSLSDGKGIPAILEAAVLLPDCDFLLIGGKDEDIARQAARIAERRLTNIALAGFVPQREVAQHLWNADVLLLPPSAERQMSEPLKLGEYLASGTPTVVTRIPAMDQLVTDEQVVFVTPGDPVSLADGVRKVLADPAYAAALAHRALRFAETHSYESRCQKILKLAGF